MLDLGPGIIYNVPGRTGQDIPDEVIMGLSNHANFLGVKECTGNERIGGYSKQGVSCWSGRPQLHIVSYYVVMSCRIIIISILS